MDLVVQVESTNLDMSDIQDGYATLVCQVDGVPYWGEDEIKLVPPQ